MKLNKKSIAIVGGGILGMTLGLRLAERGFLITIIEADSELGGLLSSFDIGGYKWDKFYHVLLQSNKNLINLLVRLGLDKEINWGKTKSGFFIDGKSYSFPCSKVAHVCPQLSNEEKRRLQSIKYQGILCASLLLKSPLSGYYITNITDESIPFTAVIEMTALVDNGYFDGNTLVYLPRYLTSDDLFFEKSDKEIHDEFFSSLKSMYPVFHRDELLYFKIEKVCEVLPLTTLNYSVELLPPTKTSLDRLYIVNSAQIENGTLNVNEIYQATGEKPVGFRGPGFCWNHHLMDVLGEDGYLYDASTLPTYLGPLARKYYFWKSNLREEEKRKRATIYGNVKDNEFLPCASWRVQIINSLHQNTPQKSKGFVALWWELILLFVSGKNGPSE